MKRPFSPWMCLLAAPIMAGLAAGPVFAAKSGDSSYAAKSDSSGAAKSNSSSTAMDKAAAPAKAGDEPTSGATATPPPGPAGAQAIGNFGAWTAAFFTDGDHKVCYMAAAPVSTETSAPIKGRDKNVQLFITQWPADNEKDAVTISAGYSYKPGSKAVVTVGSDSFSMAVGGPDTGADADMSWFADAKDDAALTAAIQKGENLTVKGTSKRGTTITDTYSLKGSADAYKAISKTCGY